MITETVVNNPEKYSNCGNYLGDLFSAPTIDLTQEEFPKEEIESQPKETQSEVKKGDRYSY